jgi:hypothetical protein
MAFRAFFLALGVLRWMMCGMVHGNVASWQRLYLAARPSLMGVHVDTLVYPLHRPMTCSHQTRGHVFLLGVALSHHVVVGGGASPGDAKPPGLDICWSVDRLGTCDTESYMA